MKILWILSITLNFYTHVITVSICQTVSVPESGTAFKWSLKPDDEDTIIEVQRMVNEKSFELMDVGPIVRSVKSSQFAGFPVVYYDTETSSETVLLLLQDTPEPVTHESARNGQGNLIIIAIAVISAAMLLTLTDVMFLMATMCRKSCKSHSDEQMYTMEVSFLHLLLVFLATPAPACSRVTVNPPGVFVSTPRSEIVFICSSTLPEIVSVQWLINGSLLESQALIGVSEAFSNRIGVGTLVFDDPLVDYNNSIIRCSAAFSSGTTLTSSEATLLLIQGLLPRVTNLIAIESNSNISVTWMAPFSLDIDDVDPDIEGYCIDFTNDTSGSLLNSVCSVEETKFSYPIPPRSWCYYISITVIPVNLVGNGTAASTQFPQAMQLPTLLNSTVEIGGMHVLTLSAPVCTAELTFLDLDTGSSITITDLTVMENVITFSTEELMTNRIYTVVIHTENIAFPETILNSIISTHDIVDANFVESDGIEVKTTYSEYSSASGALFSFVYITDSGDVDFSRSALLALDRNTSRNHTLPFDLYPGRYEVNVYDVEQDGTLSNGVGYPAVRRELSTRGNGKGPSFQLHENCQITSLLGVIEVECTFLSDVAIAFQVVVQSSSASEVHIIFIYQSTDLQTPLSVPVDRDGMYQVSIFAIRGGVDFGISLYCRDQVMVMNAAVVTSTAVVAVPGVPWTICLLIAWILISWRKSPHLLRKGNYESGANKIATTRKSSDSGSEKSTLRYSGTPGPQKV